MQKYIDQLLEDIEAAHRLEQDSGIKEESGSLEEHFDEIENWLIGEEPAHDFSYYCGLHPNQFPPEDNMTIEQLKMVYKAYKNLLYSWNLGAHIPTSVPLRLAYPLLIGTLTKKVTIVNSGFMDFEFCTCNPPSCPFEKYCTCIKYGWCND